MLEALGLDALCEEVYRLMLARPSEPISGLAAITGTSEDEIRRAMERLSASALVYGDDHGARALSPQTAMDLVLARRQSELASAQMKLEASRAAAARLIAACSDLVPAAEQTDFERLTGAAAIRERLAILGREAEDEVMTFAPAGAHSEEDLAASRIPNGDLLERGVRIRTVYVDSIRNHQPTLDHVGWLHARGAEVRTVASLPIRMVVVDRRQAVLPLQTSDARLGAMVIRGGGAVAAMCALFELVWATATPLGKEPQLDDRGLAPQEAEVLRLLARGLTDEGVAKRLGVSPRTARRLAAELMKRLDAQSRFEAGVHAVQRGWLPSS